ncbi:class I SAM-dependent methyltransferase [Corynebacterium mendelii]|uniref:Class I SAM-dependent methyltransferase n=1 Tax=Corynebacterium mendelii TaxID=2765362 RepID=A0A939IWW6_9CORY|nr:class I SAM-dependent methyltransferase [Corynebacterium mendelii]MBN9643865.1 class I SAM-dependent methyltransferase [Corynebacterium mendelii]
MADHSHNMKARFSTTGPIGVATRGTTNTNRLRKADRWMIHHPDIRRLLLTAPRPVAVDVGYGASHTTTCEWAARLRTIRADIAVTGLEIHPDRVLQPRDGVTFALGGFELAGLRPQLVRAFNVLRQYDVDQVYRAWETVTSNMDRGGLFVEGTCDEIGRRATWILLDRTGPVSLSLCWDPHDVDVPSRIAERLPKILIHLNTPGNRIHRVLSMMDDAWQVAAPLAPFGPRVRWREALRILHDRGLEFTAQRRVLRDNQITLPWHEVAPL